MVAGSVVLPRIMWAQSSQIPVEKPYNHNNNNSKNPI